MAAELKRLRRENEILRQEREILKRSRDFFSPRRKSMRFRLIDAAKKEFPVQRLCKVLGVSQSGYFARKDRPACRRQHEDMVLLAHIRSAFALSNATYGSPRMTRELRDDGITVGRHRVARLMGENALKARQRRRFKRTTDSLHAFPVAPNLLNQDFNAAGPNQKWGADISYVWTREGWLYLAVVIDLFARRVVGWAAGDRLHKELALLALRRAVAVRCPSVGLIHHADRGSQYCSIEYQAGAEKERHLDSPMSGRETASTTPWSRRSSRPSRPNSSGAPSSRAGSKRRSQSAVTSTASTIPSAAIRRSTSSARFSSKGGQCKIENALHKCRASPQPLHSAIEFALIPPKK